MVAILTEKYDHVPLPIMIWVRVRVNPNPISIRGDTKMNQQNKSLATGLLYVFRSDINASAKNL